MNCEVSQNTGGDNQIQSESDVVIVEESSLADESIARDNELRTPSYQIIENGSKKNTDLLLDGKGFAYSVKAKFTASITWMCTRRSGPYPCRGTVRQVGNLFFEKNEHNHEGESQIGDRVEIRKAVKTKALENPFQSATTVVEDVFLDFKRKNNNVVFPHEGNTIRAANRAREKLRPKNPTCPDFTVDEKFIPSEFYRGEVFCGKANEKRRHLIFMSNSQKEALCKAKRWYVDGTFKIVDNKLFCQLFSIHAFFRKGSQIKQVPLAFVLMTSRKALDYEAVFKKILEILPFTRVKEIVSDYEKAVWKAVKKLNEDPSIKTFKNVKQFGCAFHFTQAIFRKIQKIGLGNLYCNNRRFREQCRRLMCINLIDYKDIPVVLEMLHQKSFGETYHEQFNELLLYVQQNWIENVFWVPKCWSVYKQPVRTNNDVEGWHLRLNKRGRDACPPFYSLVKLLHKEAELVPIHATLLSQKKLKRSQKKMFQSIQSKLFSFWSEYDTRKHGSDPMTSWKLLKLVSSAYTNP